MLSLAAARRLTKDGSVCTLLPYRKPSREICAEFESEGFTVIGLRDEPAKALWACRSSNIRIGGGHAIRNDVSFGWLLFTSVASRWASLLGKSVRVIGSGATPLQSTAKRLLFSIIFSTCDKVCVRDKISAAFLLAEFPTARTKIEVTGDLAFLKDAVEFNRASSDGHTCLVSPGIDANEGRQESPSEILAVLRKLSKTKNMRHVILVSHDSRDHLGGSFCESLEAKILEELSVTVERISDTTIRNGLLAPYARSTWIITGRLHGLIVGALYGRNVLYTTGSADKLRPFAEIFKFRPAHELNKDLDFVDKESMPNQLLLQQKAAELNFFR